MNLGITSIPGNRNKILYQRNEKLQLLQVGHDCHGKSKTWKGKRVRSWRRIGKRERVMEGLVRYKALYT